MTSNQENSTNSPRVAVLIPTYNRPDSLRRAIESIRRQQFADWHLYVINDGGEEVGDLVGSFGDARLHYIAAPHRGKCAALNQGLAASQSEFIAYLDDDDMLYPNHLQLLVAALDRQPEAVAAYSDTYQVHLRQVEGDWQEVKREVENTQDVTLEMLLEVNYVNHKNIVHRRSVLTQTGLYDEALEVLIDWDIALRLFAAGPVVHVREITGEHFLRTDDAGNVVNAITGVYYKNREKYAANRCRVLAGMVNLPLIAQGPRPPSGEAQKIARLVQARLLQALPIADSKEEVDNLRKACREQWQALARVRANPFYKIYRALKAIFGPAQ